MLAPTGLSVRRRQLEPKWFLALLAVLVALGAKAVLPRSTPTPQASPSPAVSSAPSCTGATAFRAHVYHPQRLVLQGACYAATGVVELARNEPDGDRHVLLKLDAGEETMLNGTNLAAQHGDLVVEPVCVDTVTQLDAVQACAGAPTPAGLQLLVIGHRVRVTGDWVLDQQHGWMELHPVFSVEAAP